MLSENEILIIAVFFGVLSVLTITFFLSNYFSFKNKKKLQDEHYRERIRVSPESREREKEEIGNWIHDEITADLTLLKMSSFGSDSQGQEKVEAITKKLSSLSHQMAPKHVLKYGLKKGLEEIIWQLKETDQWKP